MSFKARTAEARLQATSRMIELMELAALRLMKALLADGQSSVAMAMELTYAAPSVSRRTGGKVRAVASFRGVTGRLYRFTIHAFDESGLIGSAEHTRAVMNERRLLAVARRRSGKAAMLLNV
jgi:predicted thioesterase